MTQNTKSHSETETMLCFSLYPPLVSLMQDTPELSGMPLQVPAASRWLKWPSDRAAQESAEKHRIKGTDSKK